MRISMNEKKALYALAPDPEAKKFLCSMAVKLNDMETYYLYIVS